MLNNQHNYDTLWDHLGVAIIIFVFGRWMDYGVNVAKVSLSQMGHIHISIHVFFVPFGWRFNTIISPIEQSLWKFRTFTYTIWNCLRIFHIHTVNRAKLNDNWKKIPYLCLFVLFTNISTELCHSRDFSLYCSKVLCIEISIYI